MKGLKLADDLVLPLDAATQAIGVVAARGSGKSYLSAVLAEEMIAAGLPVAILDPIGVFFGLRSSADGKGAGLPVVILGGEHGDVPLEATAGKVIADWIVAERRPAVLDLSLMRKGEQRQFVTDFAEQIYRKNRDPLHLILDEADLFCPQRPMPGEQRMLGAIEDLVRRGRARGLGLTLVTQRPAVIAKDVLTQVSVLVALRMLGPQDRAAVDAWIKFHGSEEDRQQVLSSLPSLPIGTAWFWSPGWLGILKKVAVRRRRTFDSSSTPSVGTKRIEPQKLAPVDLDVLRDRIAATIERAKADDPKELSRTIAELQRRIRELEARPAPVPTVEQVEVPILDAGTAAGFDAVVSNLRSISADIERQLAEARTLAGRAAAAVPVRAERPKRAVRAERLEPHRPVANGHAAGVKLALAERKVLTVLAQFGPSRKSKVSAISGYAVDGGGFNNALSALRSRGWIEGGSDGLSITDAGVEALGHYDPLPTGHELLSYWYGKLGRAERLALEAIAGAFPSAISKEDVARIADYAVDGGGFNNALSRLRTLELIEGRGELRASENLFA